MDDASAPRLDVEHLSIDLSDKPVVRDVALKLAPGEVVALLGPNGAGKTTLLRGICGIIPHRGSIRVAGRPIGSFDRRQLAQQIAYLPQETWSPFGHRVEDVVRLGRYPYVGPFRALGREDLWAVHAAMDQADILSLRDRPIDSLSGGERRRVHLARAIAQESSILVLDEPTSALDVGHALALIGLLTRLTGAGRTVLMSMHDVMLAPRGATRALLLANGRIVAEGDPVAVLTADAARAAFGVELVAIDGGRAVMPS